MLVAVKQGSNKNPNTDDNRNKGSSSCWKCRSSQLMCVCVLFAYGFVLYVFFVSARVAVNLMHVHVIPWFGSTCSIYLISKRPPGCLYFVLLVLLSCDSHAKAVQGCDKWVKAHLGQETGIWGWGSIWLTLWDSGTPVERRASSTYQRIQINSLYLHPRRVL